MKPNDGRLVLHGRDVSSLGPSGRSRLGLGRTFQRAALFESLTVRQNVALGREASMAGRNPVTQLAGTRQDRRTVRRAVDEALSLTGIEPLSDLQAGLLPTGQRRMVELARVLAGPFDLLLLDEPSAGLDESRPAGFGDVLTDAVAAQGVGILLVEHDMELVRQVCDRIYVLDFGELDLRGVRRGDAGQLGRPRRLSRCRGSGRRCTPTDLPGASMSPNIRRDRQAAGAAGEERSRCLRSSGSSPATATPSSCGA